MDVKEYPMVSVLIPCYNGEKFVDRCLNSVLNQDYPNVQVVIVNDGSTDHSVQKISVWKKPFEKRKYQFEVIHQENKGVGGAINTGLKYIQGDYLTLLDIDDMFLEHSIRLRAEYLNAHPDCGIVRSNGWYTQEEAIDSPPSKLFITNEQEKNSENLFEDLLLGRTCNWPGSYMLRTKILFDFYPDRNIYASRYGQNLQLMLPVSYKIRCGFIDIPLMKYISQPVSLSQTDDRENHAQIRIKLLQGFWDIKNFLIGSIVKDTAEYQFFTQQNNAIHARLLMEEYAQIQEKEELKRQYQALRQSGYGTLKDAKRYFLLRYPFFQILLKLKKKLLDDIWIQSKYIIDFWVRHIKKQPNILSVEKTLDYILKHQLSFARYGDGELSLIYGGNIDFQTYDIKLAQRLKEILLSNETSVLLGLPGCFGSLKKFSYEPRAYWKKYMAKNRSKIMKLLRKNELYGDSLATRFYLPYKNKSGNNQTIQKFRKLWDKREIVFVEGEKTRLGVGNDLFSNAASIKRVIIPAENAFRVYDDLLHYCLTLNQNTLFVLAAGPTATVLAYDLASEGYQALDLGHLDIQYEWYNMAASEKIPVLGKYVNEAKNGNIVSDQSIDQSYYDSILIKIT